MKLVGTVLKLREEFRTKTHKEPNFVIINSSEVYELASNHALYFTSFLAGQPGQIGMFLGMRTFITDVVKEPKCMFLENDERICGVCTGLVKGHCCQHCLTVYE